MRKSNNPQMKIISYSRDQISTRKFRLKSNSHSKLRARWPQLKLVQPFNSNEAGSCQCSLRAESRPLCLVAAIIIIIPPNFNEILSNRPRRNNNFFLKAFHRIISSSLTTVKSPPPLRTVIRSTTKTS